MAALVRDRRVLLNALAALALAGAVLGPSVACGPGTKGGPVGLSTAARGGGPRDAAGGGGALATDAGLPDYHATFTKVTAERFVSQGHAAGRFEVDVWANEAGKSALADQHGTVPVGAAIVMEHWEGGKRGPIMMMEKREAGFDPEHGDWRWLVVGSSGAVVKEGKIDSCAGCHGDAPFDHLFRLRPDAGSR
jgi:hypothetical protein